MHIYIYIYIYIYIDTKYTYILNTSLITENKVYDLSKSMTYRGSPEFCINAGKHIRDQQYGNRQ